MQPFDPTPDVTTPTDPGPSRHRPHAREATQQQLEPARRQHVAPVRVSLELDLSPASVQPGYARKYIDTVELNSTPQRAALKLLTATLRSHRTELCDGTRIEHEQQAIQYLLERIAIGLPSELLDELMEGVH